MELDQMNEILKKLEGVYKITVDTEQKVRVKKEINRIRGKIKDVEDFGPEEVLEADEEQEQQTAEPVEETSKKEEKREFEILSKFSIKKIHSESTNPEVNMAITYIEIFENELWGALSDFYLKLDYFHSRERDKFYNTLENVKRFIREYVNTLNEFTDTANDKYKEKLKSMRTKYSRSLLIDSVKFITDIMDFVNKLINDHESDGHIILNPDEKIMYSDIEGKRILDKWNIIDALRYIRDFCKEFIEAINLPEEMLDTS